MKKYALMKNESGFTTHETWPYLLACALIAAAILSHPCEAFEKKEVADKTVILNYTDFGPQAASYKLIGMQWWQWEASGGPDPATKYDIIIVVYKDVDLEDVKKTWPLAKEKKKDYRYVSYGNAMKYLDNAIKENVLPELTEKLRETRKSIEMKIGD